MLDSDFDGLPRDLDIEPIEGRDNDERHRGPDVPPDDLDNNEMHAPHQNQHEIPPAAHWHNPLKDLDLDQLSRDAKRFELQRDMQFILALHNATLDDGVGLIGDALERLRTPPQAQARLDDPDIEHGISLFLALEHASESAFNKSRAAALHRHPEDNIPTLHQVKKIISDLSGITSIIKDQCINSCVAFVGPYTDLDSCPICDEPRYDLIQLQRSRGRIKHPRQVFHTFPIGPQLQALWRHPDSAELMQYRKRRTEQVFEEVRRNGGFPDAYDDIVTGRAYLEAVQQGRIKTDDMVLMMSLDGAQLYENKQSDVWIYIWIIVDISPAHRYKKKHVIIGAVIPGPNKPKYIPSFLYPGLHHLAALQREGLTVWDARRDVTFISHLFLFLALADGPGLTCVSNLVGHSGKNGCRMLCGVEGRRRPGGHYYPALLRPNNYNVSGCNHEDLDPAATPSGSSEDYVRRLRILMASPNQAQYEKRRLQTGIVGPSILLGLDLDRILGIPEVFSSEIMHFSGANMAALFTDLWCGTMKNYAPDDRATWDWAVLVNDTWEEHGSAVAACRPYLPGSFDNPPRNPAEKMNTHYKAREFITWLFGLGPALLYGILPHKYWLNLCKFTRALRIMSQYSITSAQLADAFVMFVEWEGEFEEIYYQRLANRLHFVRPCVHLSNHLAPEASRVGSPICSSQWTMERTFADVEFDLRQPKLPYACLTQVCLLRCQTNALKSMFPHLDPPEVLAPRYSLDVGNGYVLLRARDKRPRRAACPAEAAAMADFLGHQAPKFFRWARLRLPNGQISRSAWKEKDRPVENSRSARNVKANCLTC
jgi:hypothetical protein